MGSRVSAIVPTYNRAHLVPECLDALLAQTVAPFEIIVVNDGSTDATREVLERYSTKVKAVHKSNGGKASALNVGLSVAAGDLIWIFDDDDLALPHALESQLEVLSGNPGAEFTYSGYHLGVRDPETGKLKIAATYEPFRGPAKSLFLAFAMGASGPEVAFMSQGAMLVRKRCYDVAGPFDESLTRSEDLDMNLRLCRAFRGVRIEVPTFIIRRHAGARGPAADRYSFSDRDLKLAETDRKVFQKLYETTDLAKFLDEGDGGTGRRGWEGEALVNRARVMAKWGHHDLVMRDLGRLRELAITEMVGLSEALVHGILLVEAAYQRASMRAEAREVYQALRNLVGIGGDDGRLRRYLARHYYWRGRERFAKGDRRELVRGIARAAGVSFGLGRRTRKETAGVAA